MNYIFRLEKWKMKLHIFCIVAFSFSQAYGLLQSQALDILKNNQRTCMISSHVSNGDVEQVRRKLEISDDGKMDGFALCMLRAYKIVNADGTVNQNSESYTLISDNPERYQTADKCKVLTGKNVNETARKVMNCFLKSDIFFMDPRPLAV